MSGRAVYAYVGNDPLDRTDPTGNCPECLGALIGGGLELVVQAVEIGTGNRESYDWKAVGVSAVAGATGVGAARLIGRAAEIGRAAKFVANRLSDGAVSAGAQAAKDGKVSLTSVAVDVVAGAAVGDAVGGRAGAAAARSAEGQVLERQASRAERIAANSTRDARQTAAADARAAAVNHTESAAASAGAAASNAASSAFAVGCVSTTGNQQCAR